MSGLSSLSGIPSPLKRTGAAVVATEASEKAGPNLTSLSNAPSLGPTKGARPSSASAESESSKQRPTSVGRSRPGSAASGGIFKEEEEKEEALYPKARRLVKDTPKKAPAAAASLQSSKPASRNSSDDEDDVPPPRRAPGRPVSAATGASRALGSSKPANPILAMLDSDDEDDDFLKSLAPPKKGATPPTAAKMAGGGATREGPGHRSVPPLSGAAGGRGGGGRGGNVGKSVDTLMNFLKDDIEALDKSISLGDDGGNILGGPRSSSAPKQGRRGGGGLGSGAATGDVSSLSDQASVTGSGTVQPFPLSDRQKFTDEVGRGVQEAQLPAHRHVGLEPEPSSAAQGEDSDDEGLSSLGPPQQRPGDPLFPSPKHPKPASQPVHTPSVAPTPTITPMPAPAPAASSHPPASALASGSTPAPARQPPQPQLQPKHAPKASAASDSWDLDADSMLPDDSGAPPAAPAAVAPMPAASGSPSPGPLPGVQTFRKSSSMVDRPLSRDHMRSSSQPPANADSQDKGPEEEGGSGYMPSFVGGARAKSPLAGRRSVSILGAAAPDGQHQRRPVSAAGLPAEATGIRAPTPTRGLDKGPTGGSLGRHPEPKSSPGRRNPFDQGLNDIFGSSTEDEFPDFLTQPRPASRRPQHQELQQQQQQQPPDQLAAPSPASRPINPPVVPYNSRPISPLPGAPAAQALSRQQQQGAAGGHPQVVAHSMDAPPPSGYMASSSVAHVQGSGAHDMPHGGSPFLHAGPSPGIQASLPSSSSNIPPNFVPLGSAGPPPGIVPLGSAGPPPGIVPLGMMTYSPPGAVQHGLGLPSRQKRTSTADGNLGGVGDDATMYKQTRQDFHSLGNENRRWLQEENAKLRMEVSQLEAVVKDKSSALSLAESKLVAAEAHHKVSLAEYQALAVKEAATLRNELEDSRQALERIRIHYAEAEAARSKDAARLQQEKEQAIAAVNAELAALRREAMASAAAAEARGKRLGAIEKEVAEAQIKAQQASLADEKEVVLRHRLSSDLLVELADKIRAASNTAHEREERTLFVLERDVKDRESRLVSRERLLSERESRVSEREGEIDSLRVDLQRLSATLESAAIHQREDIHREQIRLGREALRIDAVQGSVLAEREDLRVQVAMERKLLEEAREARRREREQLITEVAAERREIAAEYADTLRRLDAARTEMLQLKNRLVEYEARASAALQQALVEEERLDKVSKAATMKQEMLDAAFESVKGEKAALEAEAKSLIEHAARLEAQSSNLAASSAQLDAAKAEFDKQRQDHAVDAAHVKALGMQAEENQRQINLIKQGLDHERVSIAQERRSLAQERLDASKAVDSSREAQRKLAEAVRAWVTQGVPIPFAVDIASEGDLGLGPLPSASVAGPVFHPSPSKMGSKGHYQKEQRALRGGHYSKTRAQSGVEVGSPGKGRNRLKHELGLSSKDAKQVLPGTGQDYIRQQKEFLINLKMPAGSGMDSGFATFGTSPDLEGDYPHTNCNLDPGGLYTKALTLGPPLGPSPKPATPVISAAMPFGTHSMSSMAGHILRPEHPESRAQLLPVSHQVSGPRPGGHRSNDQKLKGVGLQATNQQKPDQPQQSGAQAKLQQQQRQHGWYGHATTPAAPISVQRGLGTGGPSGVRQPGNGRPEDTNLVSNDFTLLLPVSGSSDEHTSCSSTHASSQGGQGNMARPSNCPPLHPTAAAPAVVGGHSSPAVAHGGEGFSRGSGQQHQNQQYQTHQVGGHADHQEQHQNQQYQTHQVGGHADHQEQHAREGSSSTGSAVTSATSGVQLHQDVSFVDGSSQKGSSTNTATSKASRGVAFH